jgi:hypothetical protein
MTIQENYARRMAQGATVEAPERTIEELAEAYQKQAQPSAAYRIVDAYDVYLWNALADSTRFFRALVATTAKAKVTP